MYHQLGDKTYQSCQTLPIMPLTFLLCLEREVHTSLYCIISVNLPLVGCNCNYSKSHEQEELSNSTTQSQPFPPDIQYSEVHSLSSTVKRVKSEPLELGKYCEYLQACYTTVKKKRPYNRRQFKYCVRHQTWQLHYIIVLNTHVQHCNQRAHQLYCKRLASFAMSECQEYSKSCHVSSCKGTNSS
jgi:hypothetical protein